MRCKICPIEEECKKITVDLKDNEIFKLFDKDFCPLVFAVAEQIVKIQEVSKHIRKKKQ